MVSVALPTDQNPSPRARCTAAAPPAIVILVAGMTAAWFAAGSTGLLGHPLQHALTWLALAVALVAAWPRDNRSFGIWAILAGGVLLGLLFTTSTLPTVNVLAVTVVLAAIAQVSRGLTGRVALIAAFAAGRSGCIALPATRSPPSGLSPIKGLDVRPACRLADGQSVGSRCDFWRA